MFSWIYLGSAQETLSCQRRQESIVDKYILCNLNLEIIMCLARNNAEHMGVGLPRINETTFWGMDLLTLMYRFEFCSGLY